MNKAKIEMYVRDLGKLMPEGTSIALGETTKSKDGISYQSVKVLAASGNGADPVVNAGVRQVVAAFRDAGSASIVTRTPGGQEVRVMLDSGIGF